MTKKEILNLTILLFAVISLRSQNTEDRSFKNGIENISTVSLHPFGMFSSRINQNFKYIPTEKYSLTFSYESANTFHPYLEAYYPEDPNVRVAMSQRIWYDRPFNFIDQKTTPAEYTNIKIDAVIKSFRLDFNMKLAKEHELGASIRSYVITNGKTPISTITGDDFLEWFHSNIAGGEDPFGRKHYGMNLVDFIYTDRNGENLTLNDGDFFIGGVELNYYYYPQFLINQKENFFMNLGIHTGYNTSKFNSSIDVGISLNSIKKINFKNKNHLNIALGTALLRKNLIDFSTVIDLGNNSFLGSFESEVEYTLFSKRNNYHSFGILYHFQTSYFKKSETDYYKLLGEWDAIHAGWHNGITTLHKNLSDWTFMYTFGTKKIKLSLYLKEDLTVNNAPDIQTGIGCTIPFGS